MNEQNDIAEKHWFTNRQVISLLIAVIVATFSLTGIWFEFEYTKTSIQSVEMQIEYERERVDRKYNRLEMELETLKNAIKELSENHPDSNKK